MSEFFTLACPTCGGQLEITDDAERFACGYCRYEHLVERRGGTVILKAVSEELSHIRAGTDRTAAELAIRRLQEEIRALQKEDARLSRQIQETHLEVLRRLFLEENYRQQGFLMGLLKQYSENAVPALESLSLPQLQKVVEDLLGDYRPVLGGILFVGGDIRRNKREPAAADLQELIASRQTLARKEAQLAKNRQIVDAV